MNKTMSKKIKTNKAATNKTNNSNNLNNNPNNPFVRVPNYILNHSLKTNKYILPLYIYSAINQNIYYGNIVDTNISLIADTFAPEQRLVPSKIRETLSYLTKDAPDVEDLEGFSYPLQPVNFSSENIAGISKSARLQYIFLDREATMDNSWTKLYFDEYYYLLDSTVENNRKIVTKQKRIKYNTIELINLYLYFKQRITMYSKIQSKLRRELNSNITCEMHESLETICKNTNLARNTLTKYINQLSDLGMLNISKGKYNAKDKDVNIKTPNTYTLSNEWREYTN